MSADLVLKEARFYAYVVTAEVLKPLLIMFQYRAPFGPPGGG